LKSISQFFHIASTAHRVSLASAKHTAIQKTDRVNSHAKTL